MTTKHKAVTPTPLRPEYLIQGELQITESAEQTLDRADVWQALRRHTRGDWGDYAELCDFANADASVQGWISLYHDRHGTRFLIVTSADRSTTTVMLPSE
jgi:hypothetical protein